MITPPCNRRLKAVGSLFLAVSLAGCQPKLDPAEFGEVVHELPTIKGTEKPYPLPQLKESKETEDEAEK
jgi:hypothetical protein